MQKNYYQNTLYPLQDKILKIMNPLPVNFYLTGGTALSRIFLNHRYSDDLDFFLNNSDTFKQEVELVLKFFSEFNVPFDVSTADASYARIFIKENDDILKIDFVNDESYHVGSLISTVLYRNTDNIDNILSNKVSDVSRYAAKDMVDLIYISLIHHFNWPDVFEEASKKDLWVNPIEVSKILDEFPIQKLDEIKWVGKAPQKTWFENKRKLLIRDILEGNMNSLYNS
jgi:hypothetical protein